jgi:3D (Asp-Asp-Asp) domain-containing protein
MSVAVDPYMIPLGSKVYINYGDGEVREYRADDTGSAIAGAKIDLCVEGHQEALELGVKTVRVYWEENK